MRRTFKKLDVILLPMGISTTSGTQLKSSRNTNPKVVGYF